jgi:uncharacterized protein (TIRG00374 family)
MSALSRKLNFRILLWFLVPLLLWLVLRTTPISDIRLTLQQLSFWQILGLSLINIGLFLFFGVRWWLILRAQGYSLPFLNLVAYRLIAFSISYFTPGPQFGGEPAQVLLLTRRHSVPNPIAIASVALDKSFEILSNFTFLVVGVLIFFNGGLIGDNIGPLTLVGILIILILPLAYLFVLWVGWKPFSMLQLSNWNKSSTPSKIRDAIKIIQQTEKQISDFCRLKPWILFQAVILSGLVWVGLLTEYWVAIKFLGLKLDWPQIISIVTTARLAFLFPTPGGLGALEASQVFAMQALGLSPAFGISLSVLIRLRDLAFGGLGLWLGGMYSPMLKLSGSKKKG